MGLFSDIAAYGLALPTGGGSILLNDAMNRKGTTAPGVTDPSKQYTVRPMDNQNNYGLGQDVASPQDYVSTINNAFQNLGQASNDPSRMGVTQDFVRGLTSSFVNRYHQQTGQVPTADQVKQFIAQNATQGTAMKFVQGQMSPDQTDALSDTYIQGNPQLQGNQGLPGQQMINQLQGYADQQYKTGVQNLNQDVQSQYVDQKQGLAQDLAAQGLLNQGNSRYSLDALEANKNKTLTQGVTQLANQRAGAGLNLGLTGAQLGQQNQQFGQQLNLANRQFGEQQDVNAQNLGLANRQLNMASLLGQKQANAQQNNGLSGGLGGAASGALVGNQIMPGWGTAIGGLVGGLGGYFGSKS